MAGAVRVCVGSGQGGGELGAGADVELFVGVAAVVFHRLGRDEEGLAICRVVSPWAASSATRRSLGVRGGLRVGVFGEDGGAEF